MYKRYNEVHRKRVNFASLIANFCYYYRNVQNLSMNVSAAQKMAAMIRRLSPFIKIAQHSQVMSIVDVFIVV